MKRCDDAKPKRLTTDQEKEAQKDFSSFLTTKMSFSGFPEEVERVNQTQGAVPRKVIDHNREFVLGMAMRVRENAITANIRAYMREYSIFAPMCGYAHRRASEKSGARPSLII